VLHIVGVFFLRKFFSHCERIKLGTLKLTFCLSIFACWLPGSWLSDLSKFNLLLFSRRCNFCWCRLFGLTYYIWDLEHIGPFFSLDLFPVCRKELFSHFSLVFPKVFERFPPVGILFIIDPLYQDFVVSPVAFWYLLAWLGPKGSYELWVIGFAYSALRMWRAVWLLHF